MKKIRRFSVYFTRNFKRPDKPLKIEVFINQEGGVCLEVPENDKTIHFYRKTIIKSGISFTHPDVSNRNIFILVKVNILEIKDVEDLFQRFNVKYKEITEILQKSEVCHVS